jgi:hypothetical protein
LLETKVSDEATSPPQVVDKASDSLRSQHRSHIKNRNDTFRKIVDAGGGRGTKKLEIFFRPRSLFSEAESWDKMEISLLLFLDPIK